MNVSRNSLVTPFSVGINRNCSHFEPTYVDLGTIKTQIVAEYLAKLSIVEGICGRKQQHLVRAAVIDSTPPIINLIGPDTICIELNSTFIDPWVSVFDNYYPASSIVVTQKGNLNTGILGIYILIYRATDPSGNFSETSRVVKVVEDIKSCEPTGIKNLIGNNILVYPQPVSDELIVKGNLTETPLIVNQMGEPIEAQITRNGEDEIVLNLGSLPSGVYTLKIVQGEKVSSRKVVVIH